MALKTSGAGALAALGAAMLLGGAAPAAHAAPALPTTGLPTPELKAPQLAPTDVGQAMAGTSAGLGYAVAPVKSLRLDPWAQSSADFLNNGVGVQPDNGLPALGTGTLTSPLSAGGGAKDLPAVGPLLGFLPG
ncbi:hypothetical protein AB0K43_16090 [Kitasatospora sp. NPDC049258]|uniref:hypothetical protein n=1 Tax=Kitasatospora sp. NPDC049258 TaxID=3155394 RepID=UPI003420E432